MKRKTFDDLVRETLIGQSWWSRTRFKLRVRWMVWRHNRRFG